MLLKRFDAFIEHCQDFGTRYVATETGTLDPDHPWDDFPDNHTPAALNAFVDALRPSVKLAERLGVTILLEGNLFQVVGTIEQAVSVREQLGNAIGFVMDPVNYFTRRMVGASAPALNKLFGVLGPYAPIAHGKDVRIDGGNVTMTRTGTGVLDYKVFLELLDRFQPASPLILEQIRPEELRETVDFIDRFFSD
jgi:sugar phosphate isomerase/epimerase